MKNALLGFISRVNIATEIMSQFEDRTIEISHIGISREKNTEKQNKALKKYETISQNLILK